jgi:quinol monooxygenase YgiN
MHVQVVNFQLREMDEAAFRAQCDELAPAFAAIPGLVSKVWLADGASGTYGGVYTWESRAAYEAYTRSELFAAVASNPNFANITSRDFGVLEGPTRVTHGYAAAPV